MAGTLTATDMSGKDMGAEWTTDEKFSATWRFTFDSAKGLQSEGKEAVVVSWDGNILVAVEMNRSDSAVALWSSAFTFT